MKLLILGLIFFTNFSFAGAFVFAKDNGVDIITHPTGYVGSGGELTISVCIDPTSTVTTQLVTPVKNIVSTWNHLNATSPNLYYGNDNNIGSAQIDWESIVLHEVGHCIGLAHPNLGSIAGVTGDDTNYTATTTGADTTYNLNAGADGIKGSKDDVRGDDTNIHWFNKNINNPFMASPPYDLSKYSHLVANLPLADNFVTNASAAVGSSLGFVNSEAVMQQGSLNDEQQRTLSTDDVSMIKLAMSGLDVVEGTADDYTIKLEYGGIASGCDINIIHHDIPGFSTCNVTGFFVSGGVGAHLRINTATIEIDSPRNWFYNTIDTSTADVIFSNGFD